MKKEDVALPAAFLFFGMLGGAAIERKLNTPPHKPNVYEGDAWTELKGKDYNYGITAHESKGDGCKEIEILVRATPVVKGTTK